MSDTWFFEITPSGLGYRGAAHNVHGERISRVVWRMGIYPDEIGFWRPTERWAHRALLRKVRLRRRAADRALTRDARARVYPVVL